ncbi:MAG: alpha/beta hydrolase [Alcanivorax sp.]|jgi:hypothetical protein
MKTKWKVQAFLPLAIAFSLAGCQLDFSEYIQSAPQQIAADVVFYKDVKYTGLDDQDRMFDVFVPKSCEGHCPWVFYIHGGGFTSGERQTVYQSSDTLPAVNELLSSGIAVATISYRKLDVDNIELEGLLKPLTDIKDGFQALRGAAISIGLAPNNTVLIGESAGAGAALWLGYQDDLADANDTSTVAAGISTRVQGAVLYSTQATYDLLHWNSDVMPGAKNAVFAGGYMWEINKLLQAAYGITDGYLSDANLNSSTVTDLRASVDLISFITNDDPEFWVENTDPGVQFYPNSTTMTDSQKRDAFLHDPRHAEALHERANQVGLDHSAITQGLEGGDLSVKRHANAIAFVKSKLL